MKARAIRLSGSALALGCIGFVIYAQAPKMPSVDLGSPHVWLMLGAALLCYVVSQLAAAEAWRRMLDGAGCRITAAQARSQPMVAQIGKYIPGNVAHLLGRVALGRRDGVPGGVLAAAMLLEVGITLGVGLTVAAVLVLVRSDGAAALADQFGDAATRLLPVSVVAFAAVGAGIGVPLLLRRFRSLDAPLRMLGLVPPLILHLASFAVLGVSLWAAAMAVAPGAALGLVDCTLIFAFAWAAGFAMPGAPGGIGVRDGLIALGLAASVGEGTGLAVALLHRGVSITGDAATFGLGWRMRRRAARGFPRNRHGAASFVAN